MIKRNTNAKCHPPLTIDGAKALDLKMLKIC